MTPTLARTFIGPPGKGLLACATLPRLLRANGYESRNRTYEANSAPITSFFHHLNLDLSSVNDSCLQGGAYNKATGNFDNTITMSPNHVFAHDVMSKAFQLKRWNAHKSLDDRQCFPDVRERNHECASHMLDICLNLREPLGDCGHRSLSKTELQPI